jgi:hypothetical protein
MAEQTAKMAKSHGVGRLGWGHVGLIGVQLGLGAKGQHGHTGIGRGARHWSITWTRQPSPAPAHPRNQFPPHVHATDCHARPRGSEPAHPTLTPRHVVQPASRSSRRDPDRDNRPRATQSFFVARSAILIKGQVFLSFRSIILLHHYYSAQLFLF